MLGLFLTCSLVIETSSTLSVRSGVPIAIGEINTFRLDSQLPASAMR